MAYAGSGKTTTLVEYVRAHRDQNFLVLMFNKSAAMDAEKRFTSNATCKTINSVAWNYVCYRLGYSRERMNFYITVSSILSKGLPKEKKTLKGYNKFWRAQIILETLKNFFASRHEVISEEDVPKSEQMTHVRNWVPIFPDRKRQYVEDAESVWNRMKNDGSVGLSHDGYVKLFQLSHPDIICAGNYDVRLIDEAQDMNPAMLDALLQ